MPAIHLLFLVGLMLLVGLVTLVMVLSVAFWAVKKLNCIFEEKDLKKN